MGAAPMSYRSGRCPFRSAAVPPRPPFSYQRFGPSLLPDSARISCDQSDRRYKFGQSGLQVDRRRKTLPAYLIVGHEVIALVGVGLELGKVEIAIDSLADHVGDFSLGQIQLFVANVVDVIDECVPALQRESDGPGHVQDVDESPPGVAL